MDANKPSMPFARRRGRPPTRPYDSSQSIATKTQDPQISQQTMQAPEMPSSVAQNETGTNIADQFGVGRAAGSVAPGTTVMNYEEYQQFQKNKLDMQGGQQLPANIPANMNPSVPVPKAIEATNQLTSPFPDPKAPAHNMQTDEQVEEEQRKDLLRHEAILAGKKRFREIRTNLGLDLYNYKAPNLTFLQKLNNLISAQQSTGEGADSKPVKLQFPFRRTFDPNASNKKSDQLWNQDGDKVGYSSMRRMKRRIEKEVLKQEMQFHRQQQEVKIKSLESIVKLQGDRVTRLQKQFDTALAQMVKILVNQEAEDDDEAILEQDAAKDRKQAGEDSQASSTLNHVSRVDEEASKVNN